MIVASSGWAALVSFAYLGEARACARAFSDYANSDQLNLEPGASARWLDCRPELLPFQENERMLLRATANGADKNKQVVGLSASVNGSSVGKKVSARQASLAANESTN